MNKRILIFSVVFAFALGCAFTSVNAQCTAKASGPWSAAGTWTGGVPTATETATIPNGYTVTITGTTAVCSSLTIQSGGTLNLGTGNYSPALTVSNGGAITVNSGGVLKDGSTSTVVFNTGGTGMAFTDNGSVDIEGDLDVGPTTVFSGTGTFTLGRLVANASGITITIDNTITYSASANNACTVSNTNVTFGGTGIFDMTPSAAGSFNAYASGIKVGCTINCGKDFVINNTGSTCTITNGGSINALNATTGRIRVGAGTTANTCSLTVNSGGTLSCANYMTIAETASSTGFTFSNAGTVTIGSYIDVGTTALVTGGTIANTGTFYSGNGDEGSSGVAFTNSANGNLYFQGTTFSVITLTASASGNTVYYNSSTAEQNVVTPATTYYNVVFSNTYGTQPGIDVIANETVSNELTFAAANTSTINLNSNTFTLGTGTGTPGALVYSGSGWFYGTGIFKRWFFNNYTVTIATDAGLFPMGSSTNYQPLWVGFSPLTTGGSMSVSHPVTTSGSTAASFTDATWAGGTALQGVSKAYWTITNTGLVTTTGSLRYGGNGFNPFVLTDCDATQSASATSGSFTTQTNATVPLEVNRTTLTAAQMSQSWYIGTSNISASPLPVQLTSFTATCDNNTALLQWSTATETNNNYFTIERTQDGVNYQAVGTVKGAGNSEQPLFYSFTDNSPLTGISYYRLSQTDDDGTITNLNNTVYVPCENDATIDAYAYKNNSVKMQVNATADDSYNLTLTDALGRAVVSKTYTVVMGLNIFTLPVNLSSGIYILRLQGSSSVFTKKLILGH